MLKLAKLVIFTVCISQVKASIWDQQLALGAVECSNDRSNAYLDVIVVYDRTIRPNKFDDVSLIFWVWKINYRVF